MLINVRFPAEIVHSVYGNHMTCICTHVHSTSAFELHNRPDLTHHNQWTAFPIVVYSRISQPQESWTKERENSPSFSAVGC